MIARNLELWHFAEAHLQLLAHALAMAEQESEACERALGLAAEPVTATGCADPATRGRESSRPVAIEDSHWLEASRGLILDAASFAVN